MPIAGFPVGKVDILKMGIGIGVGTKYGSCRVFIWVLFKLLCGILFCYSKRMDQATHTLSTETNGPGLYDITRPVIDWCQKQNMEEGLLTLFMRHTSASLTIQENADPDVCHDLQDFFARIAPQGGFYRHSAEGPDDMPAHIKSALTQVQLTIPLQQGRPALGTWQGIYVFEHRHQRHRRQVAMHFIGRFSS